MTEAIEGFRLSSQQRRLWLLRDRSKPEVYQCVVRAEGTVDEDSLRSAVEQVMARHGVLRTSFYTRPGMKIPIQVVGDSATPPWRRFDLTDLDRGEQELRLGEIIEDDAKAPFDFEAAPLLRATMVELADERRALLLTLSALVADGMSLVNIASELAKSYTGTAKAGEPEGEEPVQYLNVSEWQHELLEDEEESATGRAYWRDLSDGVPEVDLPFALQPESESACFVPGSYSWTIDPEALKKLSEMAAANQCSLRSAILTCWAILLGRLCGQEDFVIGYKVDGRAYEELLEVVGPVERTVPLRISLAARSLLRNALRKTQEMTEQANRFAPFFSHPEKQDGAAGRAFNVVFEYEEWPAPFRRRDTAFAIEIRNALSERFHVKFSAILSGASLTARLSYDPERFSRRDVRRLAARVERLIGSCACDGSAAIGDLEFLTAAECHGALVEYNDSAYPFPVPPTGVHQLFERQVERIPESIALAFEGRLLSFADVDRRAGRLARELRKLGVGPENVVGIFLERSAETILALLGVLKAGAAYAAMDLLQPRERLALMLEDCRASVILTRERLRSLLPRTGVAVLAFDEDSSVGPWPREEEVAFSTALGNLAYVVFTSGSTGKPKGVAVEHRQILNYVYGLLPRLSVPTDSPAGAHFAVVSNFAADLGNTSIFASLSSGGCLHVISEERVLDPEAMSEYFESRTVDFLKIVPAHLAALRGGATDPRRLLPRRGLVVGGEASRSAWIGELKREAACEILNHYGPAEATVGVATFRLHPAEVVFPTRTAPIGRPLANSRLYLLDRFARPVAPGCPGELFIAGQGLARGYLHQPGLTAERFLPDPFSDVEDERMYRTGDLAWHVPDLTVEFLGRGDDQVKVRGFRVELGEVQAALDRHPAVRQGVVLASESAGETRLGAYVVTKSSATSGEELRSFLQERLPEYMVPSVYLLATMPLLPSGKVDRRALKQNAELESRTAYMPPSTELERRITSIWQDALGVDQVGVDDNFFDLGGHSLLLVKIQSALRKAGHDLTVIDLFQHPTIRTLAEYLDRPMVKETPETAAAPGLGDRLSRRPPTASDVAIVGMSGRFPRAANVQGFWKNLRDGVESVRFFTDEELASGGVPPEAKEDPSFVRAACTLERKEMFDAAFFGYSVREAQLIDPQHRWFLECCWNALEDAGYLSGPLENRIGVFAGAGINTYLFNLLTNPELVETVGTMQIRSGNRSDFLATRVSYKLNLNGPSVNVQSACSTSLVAVAMACDNLLKGESDMALAGGVSIAAQPVFGYRYNEGGIESRDGHTRTFDAESSGTIAGDGVGVVVLKRLEDALEAGDHIRAVLKGWAVNNDGAGKVGFTAPSVQWQAKAVADAMAAARTRPERISYVEAHGTGTRLGDPIEVAALTRAFSTDRRGYCALGSVKTNLGHLDAAAGVAGLIKTVLALEHRQIPPSLNFEEPNPEIDFAGSPFYVNAKLTDWESADEPRQAGVSSFGIGGTNVHVILEEAPAMGAAQPARACQLVVLSARTPRALESMTANLIAHLEDEPDTSLPDLAYTLQVGRRCFEHRRIAVCRDSADTVRTLRSADPGRVVTAKCDGRRRPVVFMFSGQGSQYLEMGRGLYAAEEGFRRHVDQCLDLLEPSLRDELGKVFGRGPDWDTEEGAPDLTQTRLAQPALFVYEYSLAKLWMEWGVLPQAMVGHSVGELVAACLAGVLSLADGLSLVADRGSLIQDLPPGSMLSVAMAPHELEAHIDPALSLASLNGPELCVVSGPAEAVDGLAERLADQEIHCRHLHTSHAFHSSMMDPALEPFRNRVREVSLAPPALPFLSNVTGTWITDREATDPDYWSRHLRRPVLFSDNLICLFEEKDRVLLEVGPGTTLSTLALRHPNRDAVQEVISSSAPPRKHDDNPTALLTAVGRLWLAGADVDWKGFHAGMKRRRVPAPTYPFERERFWITPGSGLRLDSPVDEGVVSDAAEPTGSVSETHSATISGHPRPSLDNPFVAPRSDRESRIAAVWRTLLGLDEVGVYDNFFDLGGDSVIMVQLTAKLRQAGFGFSPKQVSERQTVAELASMEEPASAVPASQEPVVGDVALTPIQHYFFEAVPPEPHHWNQSILLHVRDRLDPALFDRVVDSLLTHHDALRLRFHRTDGGWRQECTAPGGPAPFLFVDLSRLPETLRSEVVEGAAVRLQAAGIDLACGPVFVATHFDFGAGEPGRLLLLAHHLVVDSVSWRILFEDLRSGYDAVSRGNRVEILPKTTSYRDWSRRLQDYAREAGVREQSDFWLDEKWCRAASLPVDLSDGPNTEGSVRDVSVMLGQEETQALLQQVPRSFDVRIDEVLLVPLVQAFGSWTGSDFLSIAFEGHGREPLFDDVDLSRTVGWFTSIHPVLLDLEGCAEDPGEQLAVVKKQLRESTERGLTYGALRYLSGDEELSRRMREIPWPEVEFLYLGQLNEPEGDGDAASSRFLLAAESRGPDRSPRALRRYSIEVNAVVAGGRLEVRWHYSENVHQRDTLVRLAQGYLDSLKSLIGSAFTLPR